MRDRRGRAFWKTVLFYALAGPLIGLLCFNVVFFVVDAWGVAANRYAIYLFDLKTAACPSPYSEHFDLGCFQRGPDPRHLDFAWPWDWQWLHLLTVLFGTYVVGFTPAVLAGFTISAAGLRDGWRGFGRAVAVGTLIGLLTGAVMLYRLENAILFFFICLGATIVCWLVARRWWRTDVTADTGA